MAAYGAGVDAGRSQTGVETAGGEVMLGDKGGAKGKAGGSSVVGGTGSNAKGI